MNFLAHLYLADPTPESLVGNLLGDFVRGRDLDAYGPEVRAGIQRHRRVDAFTDGHAVVQECKRLIAPENRRYAGMLVDIFFDHFLARDWETYSHEPLPQFTQSAYAGLSAGWELMPERACGMVARMIAEDWLTSYATLDGIRTALARLARRVPRETALASADADLELHYTELEDHFHRFFPQLVKQIVPG